MVVTCVGALFSGTLSLLVTSGIGLVDLGVGLARRSAIYNHGGVASEVVSGHCSEDQGRRARSDMG